LSVLDNPAIGPGSEARRVVREALRGWLPWDLVAELMDNRAAQDPELAALYEEMTDEEALHHFGPDEPLLDRHLRNGVRLFYAWRVATLRQRLGGRLADARMLDVGDTDGSILRALGKDGVSVNLIPAVVESMRANGMDARQGDVERLPFDDGEFDAVLCFQTLEHVPSPSAALSELARVCRPGGDVFVSVPWISQSRVQPRLPDRIEGYDHFFELSPADMRAVITHTPLVVEWGTVFRVLGPPSRLAHRVYLAALGQGELAAGTYSGFQFLHLRHATA
jgi:SAM-dependent methyltransferase